MARRTTYTTPTEQERKIRDLESDLWLAREAIIELMGMEAKALLTSFRPATDRVALMRWTSETAEKIVDLCENVKQMNYQGHPFGAPRALCPLCKQGTTSPNEYGYALPEGLIRHLTGSHNSRQCDVFGAAVALARSSIDSRARWQA